MATVLYYEQPKYSVQISSANAQHEMAKANIGRHWKAMEDSRQCLSILALVIETNQVNVDRCYDVTAYPLQSNMATWKFAVWSLNSNIRHLKISEHRILFSAVTEFPQGKAKAQDPFLLSQRYAKRPSSLSLLWMLPCLCFRVMPPPGGAVYVNGLTTFIAQMPHKAARITRLGLLEVLELLGLMMSDDV